MIPSQSSQHTIVSALDKTNELIRLKKEQLIDYDNLTQSFFCEMFGDPVVNEKGWEAKTFSEIYKLKSGEGLSAKDAMDGEIPVYGGNGFSGYHKVHLIKSFTIFSDWPWFPPPIATGDG